MALKTYTLCYEAEGIVLQERPYTSVAAWFGLRTLLMLTEGHALPAPCFDLLKMRERNLAVGLSRKGN